MNSNYCNDKTQKIISRILLNKNIELHQGEVIKEITDYGSNKRYYISNYGRVFSLCKIGNVELKPQILNGYKVISIWNKCIRKPKKIHQLVAMYFVDNPDPQNRTVVHHKDCNRLNNHYTNLEWLTEEEHRQIHQTLRSEKTNAKQ